MFFAKTVTAAGLLAVANAHQLLKSPIPFPSQNTAPGGDLAANRPLQADGSDFPCKYTGPDTYSNGEVNVYPKGSTQTLATIGSAVHGGGSCQISITYDEAPTKDSVWKVIHSIEGGCPTRTQTGNYASDPNFANPDTFDFKVPDDIPSGKGVVAWTWINLVGNREFYMNCGSVEITGDGGDQTAFDSLPDLAILNIGSAPKLEEGKTPKFANPGNSVESNISGAVQEVQNTFKLGSGSTGGSPIDSGSGSGSDSSAAPSYTASATVPGGGGVFITQTPTATATASATATATAAPSTTSVVEVPTSAASSAGPSPTSGSDTGTGGQSGACSPEGVFNCIDGTSFQQCGSGTWSSVMALAAGTQCTPGQSSGMSIAAMGKKREARALRV